MSETNFVGKGWLSANGYHINISLKMDKLKDIPVNEYGEIKLTVSKRKDKDEKSGATHFVTENNYTKENG